MSDVLIVNLMHQKNLISYTSNSEKVIQEFYTINQITYL